MVDQIKKILEGLDEDTIKFNYANKEYEFKISELDSDLIHQISNIFPEDERILKILCSRIFLVDDIFHL